MWGKKKRKKEISPQLTFVLVTLLWYFISCWRMGIPFSSQVWQSVIPMAQRSNSLWDKGGEGISSCLSLSSLSVCFAPHDTPHLLALWSPLGSPTVANKEKLGSRDKERGSQTGSIGYTWHRSAGKGLAGSELGGWRGFPCLDPADYCCWRSQSPERSIGPHTTQQLLNCSTS